MSRSRSHGKSRRPAWELFKRPLLPFTQALASFEDDHEEATASAAPEEPREPARPMVYYLSARLEQELHGGPSDWDREPLPLFRYA